jgi:hypothetical protein
MSDGEPRWGDTHGHPGCYGCQMCFACLMDDDLHYGHPPVLFLDFDGVANSERYLRENPGVFDRGVDEAGALDPVAVARLEQVLVRTGAVIVVSSTWRLLSTEDGLLDYLHRRGAPSAKIIGVTPQLTGYRGEEIRAYLKEHPDVTRFAIVDDDADMEPYYHKLVKTTWAEGMLDEHVEKLVTMLNEDRT